MRWTLRTSGSDHRSDNPTSVTLGVASCPLVWSGSYCGTHRAILDGTREVRVIRVRILSTLLASSFVVMCLQACSPTSGNVQIAVTFGGSSCGGITTNSQYPGQHNVKTLSWSLIDADLGVPRAGGNGISCVVGAGYTVSGLDFGYYALTVSAQNLLGTTCWDNRGTPVATLTSGGFYSCDGTTN